MMFDITILETTFTLPAIIVCLPFGLLMLTMILSGIFLDTKD